MKVEKRALDRTVGYRPCATYPRARDAFEAVLRAERIGPGDRVLLPAYIGWSAREGSGVYDPVAAVGAEGLFVRVDRDLHVDRDDFAAKLAMGPRAVVLIHFFGWPDPRARAMAEAARSAGIPVIEDEAHALLSDLVGNVCGRDGDAAIFSLHKQLACTEGGELRLNPSAPASWRAALCSSGRAQDALDPADFDLSLLARRRLDNAEALRDALFGCEALVKPLRSSIPPGVIPQSWPVVIQNSDRDALYTRMNESGWGATSLYHTLIDQIPPDEFPDSHWLARRIFNLPVHSDASPDSMREMAAAFIDLLR